MAIVLGSRGIVVTPLPLPSKTAPESWVKVLRDFGRSILWIATGQTGASLNPSVYERLSQQMKHQEPHHKLLSSLQSFELD